MKKIKYIIAIVILVIVGLAFAIYYYFDNNKEEIKQEEIKIEKKEKVEIKQEEIKYVYVDIKGAVNNPNVYKLEENSRVIDVINLSGGLREDADTSTINLSKKIKDEMFIIIYTKEEINKYKEKNTSTSKINEELNKNIVIIDENNDAKLDVKTTTEKKTNSKEELKDTKVNINTASKEELLTVTGIGESKANAIIKYRQDNGEFKTIEDIKNVTGIGDSLFEKIKEYITV